VQRSSFRWRIALGSALLAGGVLAGFALLSSWLIYQAKLERLDALLQSGLLAVSRFPTRSHRPLLESRLAQGLGIAEPMDVAVLMADGSDAEQYRSSSWPPDLSVPPVQSPRSEPRTVPDQEPPPPFRERPLPSGVKTYRLDSGWWRVGAMVTPRSRVAIAVSLQPIRQEMGVIRRIYLVTIPGALALIAGGAWVLSGQSLRPLHRLNHNINQVNARGLDQRLPMANIDREFEGLIQAFNAMLERLERSFHQASRFSGDAAHELKTPLAILQGELERAIQQADNGSPMQQTLSHLLAEVRRLSGIVRKLLLLSLADAGQMALRRDPVDLGAVLAEQLEDIPLLAPELQVETEIEPGVVVGCDRDLMVQVIQNLLSNAVKYNLPQGWIQVRAQRQPQRVTLAIANTSRPLTDDERVHLFDRFYRGDPARSRTTDGLGLGLSLAREIVQAHGGDLTLADSPAAVVRFSLWLPVGAGRVDSQSQPSSTRRR